ncbi:MAG: redoxin domain-containing protein [Hymenobacteraceae bacterium]|nr:redoxin domain-containing protein [Hymenobacteraceae bacterium]
MQTPRVNAPEINTAYGWLNTDRSWSITDFRGKIVLLDFWTFGCINCQHIVPDLQKLEAEYPQELVVIGVHSAKFTAEKNAEAIRKAILKFGIEHPVVNDADFTVWKQYAVNAWPTVVLIDPNGKVVGQKAGEGVYEVVKPHIERLIKEFDEELNREPLPFKKEEEISGVLRFPGKLISDADGNIWLSDSGHNRILKINQKGEILETIGSGLQGFGNGSFTDASFNEPHGLALQGQKLYIADSKNNAVRVADLQQKTVATAAGTGELEYYFFHDKIGVPVNPNSPWDLLPDNDKMYVASAGNHQLLLMDLNSHSLTRFAGTGREALADGSLREAAFNQPSGLALYQNQLYIADPEASAIRVLDLQAGQVQTVIGKGLFEFGDEDGDAEDALLQHPVGLTFYENQLYIADTYNGKIKVYNPEQQRVKTIVAGLHEPNDVLFLDSKLWVTNTNHHQLRCINLETGEKEVVI